MNCYNINEVSLSICVFGKTFDCGLSVLMNKISLDMSFGSKNFLVLIIEELQLL